MTNRIAAWLAIFIAVLLAADAIVNDWRASVFLARKFMELSEYLAFWR